MKCAWIQQHRDSFPITTMCAVLQVSKSGYYTAFERQPSPRAERSARIAASVEQVHAESHGIYGSLKIAKELQQRDDLEKAYRKTVARAMRELGLEKQGHETVQTAHHNARRSDEAAGTQHALERQFAAEAPNRK